MDNLNQSGIFYFSSTGTAAATGPAGEFPLDCRRSLKSRFDPQYTRIFLIIAGVVFLTVGLLSRVKSKDTGNSEQEMQKIQERYARLVLNQEMPKKEEPKVDVKAQAAARASAEAAAAEEAAADERSKTETVVEKTQRKQASSAQRAAKREAMKAQIGNVGVFAELTAAGTGGGGSGSAKGGVRDLIGSIDASSSLSNMSISGASFASKRAEAFVVGSGGGTGTGVGGRRGERAEGGTISTSGLSSASAGTFKSEGNIEMNNLEHVEGEAANDASRDMKTLSQVLQKYQPRLKKVYEDFLKRNPDLAGKMVVKFTIEGDGSVSNVTIISSDLKDKELERNLVRYIERIKFPPASGKITIEWPLIFSAT